MRPPQRKPTDPLDQTLDRHRADILDGMRLSDSVETKLAEGVIVSSGIAQITGHGHQDKKNAMAQVKKLMFQGSQHMSQATLILLSK